MDDATCHLDGCTRKPGSTRRGYCQRHFLDLVQDGTIQSRRGRRSPCSFEGCSSPHHAKGLCSKHYWQQKYGTLGRPPKPASCTVSDCGKPVEGHGLCSGHYTTWRRSQPQKAIDPAEAYRRFIGRVDATAGPAACHLWTGARRADGYGTFFLLNKQYMPHRWLLGFLREKPLGPDEMACHHCGLIEVKRG